MEKSEIRKIAVFRALQLGDILCSIPAIRALKSHFNNSGIFLVGLPGTEALVNRFRHYFSGFIPFPGYPGLPEQPYDVRLIAGFIKYMQEQHFDLILQMQGNGTKVNQMVELLGGRYTGGFYTPNDYKPPGELFIPYPDHGHEIERHLRLMNHLGISDSSVELEFPLSEEDFRAFNALNLGIVKDQYVCIHPGSRGSWRQWPPENFALMADLCMEHDLKAVITGTKDEAGVVNAVAGFMKHQPVIAAGRTNLGSMAVLLKNSLALVSNCTGVSHMASALKTPGIIISMDGEPHRWGPLRNEKLVLFNWLEENDLAKVRQTLVKIIRSLRQDTRQVA